MSHTFTHSTADRDYSGRTNIGEDFTPADGAPLVVALHGGTYTSEYFDIPGYSLLDRASAEGIPVIAIDRPTMPAPARSRRAIPSSSRTPRFSVTRSARSGKSMARALPEWS